MTSFSLTPLFRQTVGFDRYSDLLNAALRGDDTGAAYPPYNIEKLGEDQYRITMAVAGFTQPDITITAHGNQLVVAGKQETVQEEADVTYLHRGIANRAFQRSFSLADHVKVTGANLADGLLKIELVREVPEERKPRMIEIAVGGQPTLGNKKKAN